MTKSKGLGDTISKITKASGIKRVVDKISEVTGVPCNCQERQEKLNKMFPYAKVRQFTEDELSIYESVLPRIKGTISGQDQAVLVKLYNKVFNANKKPSGCTSCVQQTIAQLAKVYVNSCKIENNG
tara:strand:- start:703 stop:1080 length:378 start_codon:yes stop_codon:yes gene_type:complete